MLGRFLTHGICRRSTAGDAENRAGFGVSHGAKADSMTGVGRSNSGAGATFDICLLLVLLISALTTNGLL